MIFIDWIRTRFRFNKQHQAIFLMFLCTIFTSTGQILWKVGLKSVSFSNIFSFLNVAFILGFVFYGIGAMLMLVAFKSGELSVLFPIVATSYVWVSMFSPMIFPSDSMNLLKWTGVGIIMISVCMLGYGSSRSVNKND